MSEPGSISVVLPTRDRPQALRRCLGALGGQSAPLVEVIVVDDGSRDRGAVEAAVAEHPVARLVRSPGRGPAMARNLGVRAARGEIVCLLDDDCEPEPTWAARLTDAARRAPGRVAAGCTIAPPGAAATVRASQAITNQLVAASLRPDGSLVFAPSCNMAASRDVLARLPFDTSYPTAAGEDREWWARAGDDGIVGAYEPGAVVVHRQALSLRGFWSQQLAYGRGAARFRRGAGARGLAPPSFYAGLVRAAFREGAGAGILVIAAQLAVSAGVFAERRALRRVG